MSEMENIISANLKKLLKEYSLNQNELAKIAGVSESTVGKWILKKSTPRMGAIQKIADHFGLPKSYILEEKKPSNLYEVAPATVKVPILGVIACGEPILVEENFEGYRYESPDMLPSGDSVYVKAKGDSMSPTIPNGSLVLIREQPDVETGEIAAVRINNSSEITLKRLKKQGNFVMLLPDNPTYEPIILNGENTATIIGKAVRYTQDLD